MQHEGQLHGVAKTDHRGREPEQSRQRRVRGGPDHPPARTAELPAAQQRQELRGRVQALRNQRRRPPRRQARRHPNDRGGAERAEGLRHVLGTDERVRGHPRPRRPNHDAVRGGPDGRVRGLERGQVRAGPLQGGVAVHHSGIEGGDERRERDVLPGPGGGDFADESQDRRRGGGDWHLWHTPPRGAGSLRHIVPDDRRGVEFGAIAVMRGDWRLCLLLGRDALSTLT